MPRSYIGEWIRALGKRPSQVAKGIKMNEGYLSSLINHRKGNPGRLIKKRIADFLAHHSGMDRRRPGGKPGLPQAVNPG